MRERSATDGKRGRRLKYWENQASSGWAEKASKITVVPLRGMPMKKIGRSIAGGGRLRGSFSGDKTGRV